jgi:tetratricopeptide (TPR) repeat protein
MISCSRKRRKPIGLVLLFAGIFIGTPLDTVSQERQTLAAGSDQKSDVALARQITTLEAQLKTRPTDIEVMFRLAKLFHQQGTFQKSIPLFERTIILKPRHLEAHILLGMDRFHTGRAREAIEPLERAIELDPQNAEANFYLGVCFLSLDREDEATKAFKRLASQAPATVDELYLLTRAYSRLSSAMLSQLAALGENSYRMHQVRGEYFDLQNNPDQAIKEYEMAVQIRPDLASLHYVLGSAYWKHSELEKAAAELRRAIELDPKHFTAHYKLGMVLLEQNDPLQAISEFRDALAEQPGLNDGYLGLGKALFKLGQDEAAIPQLQRYVQLAPLDPTPHYLLSQIYRRLNRSEEARHELAAFEGKQKTFKDRKTSKIEEQTVLVP